MDGVAAHLEHSVSALSVLEALAAHVAVVECGLTGHVSVGGELVVLVGPVVEGEATATMVSREPFNLPSFHLGINHQNNNIGTDMSKTTEVMTS